jgi:hypothetical protein
MTQARKLDAILKVAYANNPSLLAAWKSALKLQRDPQAETTVESGGGASASPAPSPAPSPGA